MPFFVSWARRGRWNSFTLVELLVVILIIAILAALTLMAGEAVIAHAARGRAGAEIQGIGAALENYKSDNGAYPQADTFAGGPAEYPNDDVVATTNYEGSSILLYQALSGKTNFSDAPVPGMKTYMNFKVNELANTTSASGPTYITDPWSYSYGYYTGSSANPQQNPPLAGAGFFDLWSTGGLLTSTSASTPGWTNAWITH